MRTGPDTRHAGRVPRAGRVSPAQGLPAVLAATPRGLPVVRPHPSGGRPTAAPPDGLVPHGPAARTACPPRRGGGVRTAWSAAGALPRRAPDLRPVHGEQVRRDRVHGDPVHGDRLHRVLACRPTCGWPTAFPPGDPGPHASATRTACPLRRGGVARTARSAAGALPRRAQVLCALHGDPVHDDRFHRVRAYHPTCGWPTAVPPGDPGPHASATRTASRSRAPRSHGTRSRGAHPHGTRSRGAHPHGGHPHGGRSGPSGRCSQAGAR